MSAELTGKGFCCYLPVLQTRRQWKDRKKVIDAPIFPGYLFVSSSGGRGDQLEIRKTTGAVQIVGIGNAPERIPDAELEGIRAMVASGLPLSVHGLPREGFPVRVSRGVLEGLEGVLLKVKNSHRLLVSVHILSQAVAIEIDASDVEALRGVRSARQSG